MSQDPAIVLADSVIAISNSPFQCPLLSTECPYCTVRTVVSKQCGFSIKYALLCLLSCPASCPVVLCLCCPALLLPVLKYIFCFLSCPAFCPVLLPVVPWRPSCFACSALLAVLSLPPTTGSWNIPLPVLSCFLSSPASWNVLQIFLSCVLWYLCILLCSLSWSGHLRHVLKYSIPYPTLLILKFSPSFYPVQFCFLLCPVRLAGNSPLSLAVLAVAGGGTALHLALLHGQACG